MISPSSRRALLVGINYQNYPDISLNGCINDVLEVKSLLMEKFAYQESDIVLLREDEPDHLPIYDNIMKELWNLVSTSENLEEIWFHYSGHGTQITNTVSLNGSDDLLVPLDYKENGYIVDTQILGFLKKTKCRTIFGFDCCHSGTICDLQWSFQYIDREPWYVRNKMENNVVQNPDIYIFSGCMDDQNCLDTYNAIAQKHIGAFTAKFVESLRELTGDIDVLSLYVILCKKMIDSKYIQRPVLSCSSENPRYIIKKLK